MNLTCRALAVAAVTLAVAGCGSSAPTFPTAASATQYWDSNISKLAHGTMAQGDGRGCAKIGPQRYSCAGWIRTGTAGRNVLGGVVVEGAKIHVDGHPASNHAMDRWLHRFRGDPLP